MPICRLFGRFNGSDGTRARDVRRDRPSRAQRRLAANASERRHLQALFALRLAPLRMVEPILEATFGPRVGHENLSKQTPKPMPRKDQTAGWRRVPMSVEPSTAMTAILETRRLRLREFRPDDLDELASMMADEEQMRFYPRPRTRDEASAWVGRNLSLYEEHGFGFWLIESRPTAEFLGYCGIRPLVLKTGPVRRSAGTRRRLRGTEASPRRPQQAFATSRSPALSRRGWSRSSIPTTSRPAASPRRSGCARKGRPYSTAILT
jgi:GNAT acetyltransferase-like protein